MPNQNKITIKHRKKYGKKRAIKLKRKIINKNKTIMENKIKMRSLTMFHDVVPAYSAGIHNHICVNSHNNHNPITETTKRTKIRVRVVVVRTPSPEGDGVPLLGFKTLDFLG